MGSSQRTPLVLATAYDADNPMPEIWSLGVEQLGLEVRREPLRRSLLRRYPSGTTPILHLHWIRHLFETKSSIVSAVRTAKYLTLLLAAKTRRFKIVWTLHNDASHGSHHPRLERAVRSMLIKWFTDAIVVMTYESRARIAARYGHEVAEKAHYVPHPTYQGFYGPARPKRQARERFGFPVDVPIFLFFGRVRDYKDVVSLTKVFHRLDGDARLVIAGASDPDDAPAIYDATELDARIHVHLERVHDSDVADLVAASDCVVLPYREVSNSGVLLLALSYARPVVAPDAPTLIEVMGPSLAAACYRHGDVGSLEQALRDALDRHGEQSSWEELARARAEGFTPESSAAMLAEVYRSVV